MMAIDMAADSPARDAEAELTTVPATVAQIEPSRLQPPNRQVLDLVAGIEDPQQSITEAQPVGRGPCDLYARRRAQG